VANERTVKALPAGVRGVITKMAENGVDLSLWSRSVSEVSSGVRPFQLIFIGRLEQCKGAHWLLDAFARATKKIEGHLTIVGEFQDVRRCLEEEAHRLGIAQRVTFVGWVPQDRCARLLAGADALALPSVCECGGSVVLEAMASSKPVIAVNWGGPADYLDSSCGVLLPAKDPATLVHDLEKTIVALATDRDRCQRMGQAGCARVKSEYAWPIKIKQLVMIYREVLDSSGETATGKPAKNY
jgi:glycosyltransferase involved in cell wall biosynthesis